MTRLPEPVDSSVGLIEFPQLDRAYLRFVEFSSLQSWLCVS